MNVFRKFTNSFKNSYKTLVLMSNNGPMLKVIEEIFKFAEQTHLEQKPRMCKVGVLNMADGTKLGDFVTLWAGAGMANPLERIEHLRNQRDELKRLLELMNEQNQDEALKNEIKLTLKIFS